MKTRILIVEPSEIIVTGITEILAQVRNFTVLQSIDDSNRLEERMLVHKPQVIIVNPTLFDNSKRTYPLSIQHDYPNVPVIALVYQYVDQNKLKTYDAVIDIRMPKSTIIETIVSALETKKQNTASPDSETHELSERETEVLVLVAKGLSSKEIAEKLSISIHTVISHRKNITHKAGIKSVAGLAVYAILNNFITSADINS